MRRPEGGSNSGATFRPASDESMKHCLPAMQPASRRAYCSPASGLLPPSLHYYSATNMACGGTTTGGVLYLARRGHATTRPTNCQARRPPASNVVAHGVHVQCRCHVPAESSVWIWKGSGVFLSQVACRYITSLFQVCSTTFATGAAVPA
jgi:hypothetical protein